MTKNLVIFLSLATAGSCFAMQSDADVLKRTFRLTADNLEKSLNALKHPYATAEVEECLKTIIRTARTAHTQIQPISVELARRFTRIKAKARDLLAAEEELQRLPYTKSSSEHPEFLFEQATIDRRGLLQGRTLNV